MRLFQERLFILIIGLLMYGSKQNVRAVSGNFEDYKSMLYNSSQVRSRILC